MIEKTMLALIPRVKSSFVSLVAVEKQEIRFCLWKSLREHEKYLEGNQLAENEKNKREIYAKISLGEHDHHNALLEIQDFVPGVKAS